MSPISTVTSDRAAIIGDIHGRADLLRALLEKIGARDVFVLGDLCDRGPETRGVLDLLLTRGARGVLGNHDVWFREWSNGRGFDRFALTVMMGGAATLASYGVHSNSTGEIEAARWCVPTEHARFLSELHKVLRLQVAHQTYELVHAGVPSLPEVLALPVDRRLAHMLERRPDDLLWRNTQPKDVATTEATVVMGHVRVPGPVDLGHVIALDTGCGVAEGGALTTLLLPERVFVSVR